MNKATFSSTIGYNGFKGAINSGRRLSRVTIHEKLAEGFENRFALEEAFDAGSEARGDV